MSRIISMTWGDENLIRTLVNGGVAVIPTDTLYGIVGQAHNPETVNRIYTIRKRAPEKPCIILIGDLRELEKFSVDFSEHQHNIIANFSTPTSFILDCPNEKLFYLHRGIKSLAFRLPTPQALRELLLKTGPLIAPSANVEGMPPSEHIAHARNYFGDTVDLYVDAGVITGKASTVVKLNNDGSVLVIRK